jgi:hypothetical protein
MGGDVHPAVGRVDTDPMDMTEVGGRHRVPSGASALTGLGGLQQ